MMLAALLLLDAVASPAPAPASPPTLQQRFEDATAALYAHKSEEALAGFRAIEAMKVGPRTRGIVLLREGMALVGLGRDEEALAAYRKGLELVPAADKDAQDDRRLAYLGIGGIQKAAYDYAAARDSFAQARALSETPLAKLQALLPLASVAMFDDTPAALAAIDEAGQVAATTKIDKTLEATIHDVRGRVLLNHGDHKGALSEFQAALREQGGLTVRTDLRDVMVRSDVALAFLVAKDEESARPYFQMTGEGRLPDGPFAVVARTELPPCMGDLKPEDLAVVEFGIGDDGRISFADPIYASRQGPLAAELAEAVSAWAWRPEDVAKIPLFYRAVTRVEVRCSLAAQRPADLELLLPDVVQWLEAHGSNVDLAALSGHGSFMALRNQVALADKAGDTKPAETIGLLGALAQQPETGFEQTHILLSRAATLADAQHAAPAVIAFFTARADQTKGWPMVGKKKGMTPPSDHGAVIRALMARPEIAADARTVDTLRLYIASPSQSGYEPDAEALMHEVAEDKRLDSHDPLRVGALLRLASLQAQKGQMDAARSTYLSTGLNAQQCSLVDAHPAMTNTGVMSRDYPDEMVKMGVSGWTRIEFDILASGETANRRAVISYPPFSFGDATVKAMSKARYTQSYRPDGELGCGGASLQYRFLMPKG